MLTQRGGCLTFALIDEERERTLWFERDVGLQLQSASKTAYSAKASAYIGQRVKEAHRAAGVLNLMNWFIAYDRMKLSVTYCLLYPEDRRVNRRLSLLCDAFVFRLTLRFIFGGYRKQKDDSFDWLRHHSKQL